MFIFVLLHLCPSPWPSLFPAAHQVKTAYVEFLMHCYIDTDVEIKEIYTRNHMWVVFNNFVEDIRKVRREMLWQVRKDRSYKVVTDNTH